MPIVMGVSFTFVTVLCGIAVNYGYPAAVGAVIVDGLLEGVLGLFAKYWLIHHTHCLCSRSYVHRLFVAIGWSAIVWRRFRRS